MNATPKADSPAHAVEWTTTTYTNQHGVSGRVARVPVFRAGSPPSPMIKIQLQPGDKIRSIP